MGFFPTHFPNPRWSDDDLSARPPIAGINHQITNTPLVFIEEKVLHVSDHAIDSVNMKAADLAGLVKHVI